MSDVIDLLERLVSYDTRTWENTPAKETRKLFENELIPKFEDNGFACEILESEGHLSLFAEKGDPNSKPSILYSGHVDVVPWDDRWTYDPQKLEIIDDNGEKIVVGRGVSDMKSGVSIMMSALPELAKVDTHIMFGLTGDEEIGGENGTGVLVKQLEEEGKLPDYVITADAAGMEIITRRRNVFNVHVKSKKSPKKITGDKKIETFETEVISSDTSHSAYFKRDQDKHCVKLAAERLKERNGIASSIEGNFVSTNVLPQMTKLEYVIPSDNEEEHSVDKGLSHLLEFVDKVMDMDFETEAESEYGINSCVNMIEEEDDYWSLVVDVRAMLSYQSEMLEKTINEIIDTIEWDFDIDYFKSIGYIATPDDSPLVTATTRILEELGYEGRTAERGGATDGRFFAYHDIQTVDIGPIGWNVHGPDEKATVKTIEDLVTFFEKSSHEIVKDYRK